MVVIRLVGRLIEWSCDLEASSSYIEYLPLKTHQRTILECWCLTVASWLKEERIFTLLIRINQFSVSVVIWWREVKLSQCAWFANMCAEMFLLSAENKCLCKIGFMTRAHHLILFSPPCACLWIGIILNWQGTHPLFAISILPRLFFLHTRTSACHEESGVLNSWSYERQPQKVKKHKGSHNRQKCKALEMEDTKDKPFWSVSSRVTMF